MLLVATCWRTDLIMRQLGLLLTLAPVQRRRIALTFSRSPTTLDSLQLDHRRGRGVAVIEGPGVVERAEEPTLGIRVTTPFRGMFAVRDALLAELYERLEERRVDPGTAFFRLHVVDMAGLMDVEVGVTTPTALDGDDRVLPGALPAGRYASLTYVNHARRANSTLVEWIRDTGLTPDRADTPEGDAFTCRYEAYLTDPRTERMKTKWLVRLDIRVA
jgi:effector-binding domain-containing protein